MPFDGTLPTELSRLAKLEILQEIAAKSCGYQGGFSTCLLADCIRDGRLPLRHPRSGPEMIEMGEQFGIPQLFNCGPIEWKRSKIAAAISSLKQRELSYAV